MDHNAAHSVKVDFPEPRGIASAKSPPRTAPVEVDYAEAAFIAHLY